MKDLSGYHGRPVLITGADGFVGSHLADALVDLGAEVHALVRPSGVLKNIAPLADRIILLRADVRNYGQVHQTLEPLKAVAGLILFHLAAQAHVGQSWEKPEITLETNVLGTLNLLKAVRDLNLQLHSFDYAGTSEEYGRYDETKAEQYRRRADGSIRLEEQSPLNPQSVYAASKVAADFLCQDFYAAYGVPVVITRMFNNFGPRQNPQFITGSVITQALSKPTIEVGWAKAKRDFTYIDDGVRGHLFAALHGMAGEVYNFGQGRNIAISEWVELIHRLGQQQSYWPTRDIVINAARFRPGKTDEADLLADSTKLSRLTGWQPTVAWEEGLLKTIGWYADHFS